MEKRKNTKWIGKEWILNTFFSEIQNINLSEKKNTKVSGKENTQNLMERKTQSFPERKNTKIILVVENNTWIYKREIHFPERT